MASKHIQPPELFNSQPLGYTQVVKSAPGHLIHVAGQGAFDAKFKLVGGSDIVAQTEQALSNLGHALRAAGATPADLTSLRLYIVDYAPEHAMKVGAALLPFFDGAPPPAQTLIGVQALGLPGMLIEIEATAVVAS